MKPIIIRKNIINACRHIRGTSAHYGGTLSCVEILIALYDYVLNWSDSEIRDRFILSKGHGALALYCVLKEKGILTQADLDAFEADGTCYFAHAKRNIDKGIEFSGGSLSLGFSYAVGVALACKDKANHIYVLLGDGECDEGLVWEAAMAAANYHLGNLTIIIDHNELQSDGYVKDVMDTYSLMDKFAAFGWDAVEVDGHDIGALVRALNGGVERINHIGGDKPRCIIAKTIKGKGVSFMENNPKWHHGLLTEEQYKQAMAELEGVYGK